MRLPALALLVMTVLFWSLYDRYEPTGPILLEAPVLADGTKIRGDVSESNHRFMLRAQGAGKPARISFRLPSATDYESIRIRARIKVEGVVVGKYPWNCARLLITQYDANNKWISGHHGLVAEKGTKDWDHHEDLFKIFSNAVRADVVLQQSGFSGTAEFDQIEAQPARVRASFVWWRVLFIVLWLVAAGFYFPRCRLHRRRLKTLIFINVVAILAGTLMPGDWITSVSERVKGVVHELRDPEPAPEIPSVETKSVRPQAPPLQEQMDWFMEVEVEAHQVGHFVLFASLCFLVYLSAALERQHPVYFVKVGFDVLLFAAVTEVLQFLTLDRSAGVADLRIDLYGMMTALLLFLMVLPFVGRFCVKPC